MSESTVSAKTPAAHPVLPVTDSLGRKLTVQRLDALGQLDFFEAAGAAASTSSWMAMAMVAVSVRTIDGVPVPPWRTKEDIRKAVKALGMEGINAATAAFIDPDDAAPDNVTDTAKNLPGTQS